MAYMKRRERTKFITAASNGASVIRCGLIAGASRLPVLHVGLINYNRTKQLVLIDID